MTTTDIPHGTYCSATGHDGRRITGWMLWTSPPDSSDTKPDAFQIEGAGGFCVSVVNLRDLTPIAPSTTALTTCYGRAGRANPLAATSRYAKETPIR